MINKNGVSNIVRATTNDNKAAISLGRALFCVLKLIRTKPNSPT